MQLSDTIALFVNIGGGGGKGRRGRAPAYPNEWSEGGRALSWYLRGSDWKNGNSALARRLLFGDEGALPGDSADEGGAPYVYADDETPTAPPPLTTVLFVRSGNGGDFVCMGRCSVSGDDVVVGDDNGNDDGRRLIQLRLELADFDRLSLGGGGAANGAGADGSAGIGAGAVADVMTDGGIDANGVEAKQPPPSSVGVKGGQIGELGADCGTVAYQEEIAR